MTRYLVSVRRRSRPRSGPQWEETAHIWAENKAEARRDATSQFRPCRVLSIEADPPTEAGRG